MADRGFVIPIGGAESRALEPGILTRFVELCGGADARIAVIATASRLIDTGVVYQELFYGLGAHRVYDLPVRSRSDADSSQIVDRLAGVDGVFFTGGDQRRLGRIIIGTRLEDAILDGNAAGLHVGGTSAGAAFMSKKMIVGGKAGTVPRTGMVKIDSGLALIDGVIVDQHFRQRNRLGRLLVALAENPDLMGLGMDEDAAAFIDPDGRFDVEGSGAVTIIDTAQLTVSRPVNDIVSMTNLRIHIITSGNGFDLARREPLVPF